MVYRLKHGGYIKYNSNKSNLLIIGGGQIFRDNDQYLPAIIDMIHTIIVSSGKPYIILGIGASNPFSKKIDTIYSKLVNSGNCMGVYVRDKNSYHYLHTLIHNKGKLYQYPDPVFLTGKTSIKNIQYSIGFCLTSPKIMQYYSDVWDHIDINRLKKNTRAIIDFLAKNNHTVLLFSNGNPEDNDYAYTIFKSLECPGTLFYHQCLNPSDLITTISKCSSILSYRMHTNIVAFTQAVPSIVMRWDQKVDQLKKISSKYLICNELYPSPAAVLEYIHESFSHIPTSKDIEEIKMSASGQFNFLLEQSGK